MPISLRHKKLRRLIKEKFDEILSSYDFVITPTTPHVAFQIGNEVTDPTQMYLEDIFTVWQISRVTQLFLYLKNLSNKMPHRHSINS